MLRPCDWCHGFSRVLSRLCMTTDAHPPPDAAAPSDAQPVAAMRQRSALALKSAQFPGVALVLHTADVQAIARELAQRLAATPDFFGGEPLLLDLWPLRQADCTVDFAALVQLLHQHQANAIGVRDGSPAQMRAAADAGLVCIPRSAPAPVREIVREVVREVPVEVVREVTREVQRPAPVTIVDRPLRSGQQVYAPHGDLVVLAMVSYGAEVIADGSVHVYAPLRGRAIAGAQGNAQARIFSTCMQAQLLSIAGNYRAFDDGLPPEVNGRMAQARLDADGRLLVTPMTGTA